MPIHSLLFLLLATLLIIAVVGPQPCCSEIRRTRIRILPLGDSITVGNCDGIYDNKKSNILIGGQSYRRPLWHKLQQLFPQRPFLFEFVGMSKQCGGFPSTSSGTFDFPHSHEGHRTYTSAQLVMALPGFIDTYNNNNKNNKKKTPILPPPPPPPDIVLLHIGTNDAFSYKQMFWPSAVARRIVEDIIPTLRRWNPNIKVIVACPLAVYDKKTRTKKHNWNQTDVLPCEKHVFEICGELKRLKKMELDESLFTLAPTAPFKYNPFTESVDGLHPTSSGDEKLAKAFLTALVHVLRREFGIPSMTSIKPSSSSSSSSSSSASSQNSGLSQEFMDKWMPGELEHVEEEEKKEIAVVPTKTSAPASSTTAMTAAAAATHITTSSIEVMYVVGLCQVLLAGVFVRRWLCRGGQ
eukprot:PhM_4_TR17464/c0_g1_i1/m.85868